tara:strand:- start:37 stop:897 length:861 start_codon:yes stop_codon:yes gene_type:complete
MKSHVLITGGTGFIGEYLSRELMNDGYKVTTISRSKGTNDNHICADLTNGKILIDLAKKLSPIKTIIHCAAIAHGEKTPKNNSVAEFNSLISNNIIKAFNGHQLHWIFLSSISVYGELQSEFSIPLIRSPKPFDSYGMGKLHDENLFISKCKHLEILRLMPVYGSQNLRDIRKRVFLPYTNLKINIQPAPLHSICSLKEVLNAVKKCMKHKSGKRIIQVGDSQPVSQIDLANWFPGKSINVPQLLFKTIVSILPKKLVLFRKISFMLKKVGLNNIYEVGFIELDSK